MAEQIGSGKTAFKVQIRRVGTTTTATRYFQSARGAEKYIKEFGEDQYDTTLSGFSAPSLGVIRTIFKSPKFHVVWNQIILNGD